MFAFVVGSHRRRRVSVVSVPTSSSPFRWSILRPTTQHLGRHHVGSTSDCRPSTAAAFSKPVKARVLLRLKQSNSDCSSACVFSFTTSHSHFLRSRLASCRASNIFLLLFVVHVATARLSVFVPRHFAIDSPRNESASCVRP